MKHAFLFGSVAITVAHCVTHPPEGDEEGARVEVRRVHGEPSLNESASPVTCLREPIWRADLFTLLPGPPGNWDRAHFHSRFEGMEPIEAPGPQGREWDPELTADPIGWTAKQLQDLPTVLRVGGASDLIDIVNYGEVNAAIPAVVRAIEDCMHRASPAVAQ